MKPIFAVLLIIQWVLADPIPSPTCSEVASKDIRGKCTLNLLGLLSDFGILEELEKIATDAVSTEVETLLEEISDARDNGQSNIECLNTNEAKVETLNGDFNTAIETKCRVETNVILPQIFKHIQDAGDELEKAFQTPMPCETMEKFCQGVTCLTKTDLKQYDIGELVENYKECLATLSAEYRTKIDDLRNQISGCKSS